mmetsp:Transcript_87426/g.212067  ORF Transcript_87426/g.212067 Transcript_87426/m.212067 type:complete len:297 (-) Transcript_87426:60-950(-)
MRAVNRHPQPHPALFREDARVADGEPLIDGEPAPPAAQAAVVGGSNQPHRLPFLAVARQHHRARRVREEVADAVRRLEPVPAGDVRREHELHERGARRGPLRWTLDARRRRGVARERRRVGERVVAAIVVLPTPVARVVRASTAAGEPLLFLGVLRRLRADLLVRRRGEGGDAQRLPSLAERLATRRAVSRGRWRADRFRRGSRGDRELEDPELLHASHVILHATVALHLERGDVRVGGHRVGRSSPRSRPIGVGLAHLGASVGFFFLGTRRNPRFVRASRSSRSRDRRSALGAIA